MKTTKPLDKLLRSLVTSPIQVGASDLPRPADQVIINSQELLAAICSIATNAWRARSKMLDDSGETKDEMKRVYRHVDSIIENLKDLGVSILDHTNQPYDSGLAVKVISFQPSPGISREQIVETLRPSINWSGKLVQMGEVIVGSPDNSTGTTHSD